MIWQTEGTLSPYLISAQFVSQPAQIPWLVHPFQGNVLVNWEAAHWTWYLSGSYEIPKKLNGAALLIIIHPTLLSSLDIMYFLIKCLIQVNPKGKAMGWGTPKTRWVGDAHLGSLLALCPHYLLTRNGLDAQLCWNLWQSKQVVSAYQPQAKNSILKLSMKLPLGFS